MDNKFLQLKEALKQLGFREDNKTLTKEVLQGKVNIIISDKEIKGEFYQNNINAKDIMFFDDSNLIDFSPWLMFYCNGGGFSQAGTVGYQNNIENIK